jgi:signal transduction histidine kinase
MVSAVSATTRGIDDRLRESFESATATVRRAQERAANAVQHAAEIREAVKKARTAPRRGWEAGRKALAMVELAAEETARSAYEKDRFLAVASHELRQPIGAAQAALEVLEASRTPAEAARARAVLRRQLVHMARLVQDLLDISRYALQSSDLQKVPLDLRRVIETAVETMSSPIASSGLALEVAMPDEPVGIEGDEHRLVQVFTNLLSNAVRYTPAGKSITVTLRTNGGLIITEVADTGRGIDADDLPHLFEPFSRGHEAVQDGFGIGLALVRGIVERHGGSVAATSDGADRGSRFTVVLPALDQSSLPQPPRP